MTRVDILPLQDKLELKQLQRIREWDGAVKKMSDADAVREVTRLCDKNANHVLNKWWKLAHALIAKYSDGYINLPGVDQAPIEIGYSATWLSYTNYHNGPTSYDMKADG